MKNGTYGALDLAALYSSMSAGHHVCSWKAKLILLVKGVSIALGGFLLPEEEFLPSALLLRQQSCFLTPTTLKHRAQPQKTLGIKILFTHFKRKVLGSTLEISWSLSSIFLLLSSCDKYETAESFVITNGPKYYLLLYHTENELILLNFKAISNFMCVK